MYQEYLEIVVEHLLENGFSDTLSEAVSIIPAMSESWIYSIVNLSEMRKEDKVKGKKKTPEFINLTQTSKKKLVKSGDKWKKLGGETVSKKTVNPEVSFGRLKQGHRTYRNSYTTGMTMGYAPQPHGTGGINRGKKKSEQTKPYELHIQDAKERARYNARNNSPRIGGMFYSTEIKVKDTDNFNKASKTFTKIQNEIAKKRKQKETRERMNDAGARFNAKRKNTQTRMSRAAERLNSDFL